MLSLNCVVFTRRLCYEKKWISLTLLFTLLFSFLLTPLNIYGKEIDITCNTAQDATVTTSSGENVTGKDDLDSYDNYEITYDWSIPNGTSIQNGDTATFTIPDNVQILTDTSFEVKTSDGEVIGTFTIKKGQHVGTLTLNSYLSQHPMTNIHGTLSIWGNGTVDQKYEQSEIHKAGWIDGNNQPTWDILYNPNSEHRTNVVITDTLFGPQKLDPNSIQVSLGKADAQGNFTGTVDPSIKPIIDGNKFTIKIPDLNQAVQIVYHSTPTTSGQVSVNNQVSGKSDQLKVMQVGVSLTVGGSGTAGGITPTPVPSESESESDSHSVPESSSAPESTESTPHSDMSSSDQGHPGGHHSDQFPVGGGSTTSVPEASDTSSTTSETVSESSSFTPESSTTSTTSSVSSSDKDTTKTSSTSTSSEEDTTNTDSTSSTTDKKHHGIIGGGTSSSSYPNHKNKDANTISGDLPQTGAHSSQEWIFFGLVCVTLATIGWFTLEKKKQA